LAQTEAASAEILNLPIYPELRVDEQLRVVETIKRYYGKSARAAA
jgi:dTDP-4-amino-4,6-dideoxygalactose transaminase